MDTCFMRLAKTMAVGIAWVLSLLWVSFQAAKD
jgi:hypothetical protein